MSHITFVSLPTDVLTLIACEVGPNPFALGCRQMRGIFEISLDFSLREMNQDPLLKPLIQKTIESFPSFRSRQILKVVCARIFHRASYDLEQAKEIFQQHHSLSFAFRATMASVLEMDRLRAFCLFCRCNVPSTWIRKIMRTAEKEHLGMRARAEEMRMLFEYPVIKPAFSALTVLRLSCLSLRVLPEEMGVCKKVVTVQLKENKLEEIPPYFSRFTRLQRVDLSCNKLPAFPRALLNLKGLIDCNLEGNLLSTLPAEMKALVKLQTLQLSDNQLKIVPRVISRLTALKTLGLALNELASVPDALERCRSLEAVDFSGNNLLTYPDVLNRMTTLRDINLTHNQIVDMPTHPTASFLGNTQEFPMDLEVDE